MRISLLLLSLVLIKPAYAIQFQQCVDSEGTAHYTNLPLSSLDSNCKQKQSYYSMRLESDRQRVKQELETVRVVQNEPTVIDDMTDNAKSALDAVLDPEQALQQLLENTQNARDNEAARFFRARTEAVKNILQAD